MSDRVSVDELVREAEGLVWDAIADDTLSPAHTLRAWGRFVAGAEAYLLAAAGGGLEPVAPSTARQHRSTGAPGRVWTRVPRPGPAPGGAADARMLRAADLLGAAGDLIQSHRDPGAPGWQVVTDPEAQQAGVNRAANILAAAAHRAAEAADRLPRREPGLDQLDRRSFERVEVDALRLTTSSLGRTGAIDDLDVPSQPVADATGNFLAAVRGWRFEALAGNAGPVPAAHDLALRTRAGAFLMAALAEIEHQPLTGLLGQAHQACSDAGAAWSMRSTALPGQPEAAAAAQRLRAATLAFAAAAPPPTVRRHLALRETADAVCRVLDGARDSAAMLARSGLVYGPARRLGPRPGEMTEATSIARHDARRAGAWVPLTEAESAPIVLAHATAAQAAADVRLAFARRTASPRVQGPSVASTAARLRPTLLPERPRPPRRGR